MNSSKETVYDKNFAAISASLVRKYTLMDTYNQDSPPFREAKYIVDLERNPLMISIWLCLCISADLSWKDRRCLVVKSLCFYHIQYIQCSGKFTQRDVRLNNSSSDCQNRRYGMPFAASITLQIMLPPPSPLAILYGMSCWYICLYSLLFSNVSWSHLPF